MTTVNGDVAVLQTEVLTHLGVSTSLGLLEGVGGNDATQYVYFLVSKGASGSSTV